VLEDIARAAVTVALEPGAIAVRESERGDRFYVVAEGSFEVSIGGVHVRDLHRGEGFGEIALLRDGIRTATVRARGPAAVYEIGRTDFLAALGTSTAAARVAGDVMAARLEASLVR
jgi:CRP-like cAMP-binding protein